MGFAAAILAMVLLFAGCGQTETKSESSGTKSTGSESTVSESTQTESSTVASETEDETLVHVLALKGPSRKRRWKLFRYATEQRLLLDDRFYEEYMVDALTSQEMEQYITRIAVKILR